MLPQRTCSVVVVITAGIFVQELLDVVARVCNSRRWRRWRWWDCECDGSGASCINVLNDVSKVDEHIAEVGKVWFVVGEVKGMVEDEVGFID